MASSSLRDPFAPRTPGRIVIPPRPWLALAVFGLGLAASLWLLGVGAALCIFGLFLGFQTATVRIAFAAEDFEVWQYGRRVVAFPYREWVSWKLFWPSVPILFYFREVNSPHFIPLLFCSRDLVSNLEKFLPDTVSK